MPVNPAALIQAAIDQGLGAAASVLGVPFAAYRCDANATGDFPTGWTNLGTQLIRKQRVTDQKKESSLKASGTLFLDIIADMTGKQLGDVFVSADAPLVDGVSYGLGATSVAGFEFDGFSVAWRPPVGKPLGTRIASRVRIARQDAPNDGATVDGTGQRQAPRWGVDQATGRVLMLVNGVYSFTPGAADGLTGSYVPAGFGSSDRPSRTTEFQSNPVVPTSPPQPRYFLYLPPLPGYTATEGDRIFAEDGSRYTVVQPYSQTSGVVGSQLVVDRTTSGV